MGELLREPGRALRVGTVVTDRALIANHGRAAHGAGGRHVELSLGPGPALGNGAHDLRNDVARLLQHDPVADPEILAPHFVEVVERGTRHRGSGHLCRPHVRHRRQRPGPADIRNDVLQDCFDLLRWELVRDRPTRRPRDHPEPGLLVVAIDLDDHAVRLVRQVVPLLTPGLQEGDHAVDVEALGAVRVYRKAQCREPGQGFGLAGDRRATVGPVFDQLVRPR
jgi:hypothetical protein